MVKVQDVHSLSTKVVSSSLASLWRPIAGGLTAPLGFQAAGITAGLKDSGKPDMALLLAPEGAVCAGTFTTSLLREERNI